MGKYLYAKLNYQTIKLNMKYELRWTHSVEAVITIRNQNQMDKWLFLVMSNKNYNENEE